MFTSALSHNFHKAATTRRLNETVLEENFFFFFTMCNKWVFLNLIIRITIIFNLNDNSSVIIKKIRINFIFLFMLLANAVGNSAAQTAEW